MKFTAWLVTTAAIALVARWLTPPPPLQQAYEPAPGYRLKLSVASPIRELEIEHHGRPVYHRRLRCFCLYLGERKRQTHPIARDANGDGIPDLVIQEELGQQAFVTRVVQLGPTFRELGAVQSLSAPDYARDASGRLLIRTRDDIWQGWRSGCASAPLPAIVLRLKKTGFELAPEEMAGPASRSELNLEWRMTAPLYSGHPDLAFKALRTSGLSSADQKQYLRDFVERLKISRYASSLAQQLKSPDWRGPCECSHR
jgi:hypothetical protein